eukprot:scaffold166822_cov33-Tisochrysis_lutea.AAC.1
MGARATEWYTPEAMARTSRCNSGIGCGLGCSSIVSGPRPSAPKVPHPHAHTAPALVRQRVCRAPQATARTWRVAPNVRTGRGSYATSKPASTGARPSFPSLESPQVKRVPFALSAAQWLSPQKTATAEPSDPSSARRRIVGASDTGRPFRPLCPPSLSLQEMESSTKGPSPPIRAQARAGKPDSKFMLPPRS